MSQYAIVFRFELDNGSAASLNADLKIADSNTISLAGGADTDTAVRHFRHTTASLLQRGQLGN